MVAQGRLSEMFGSAALELDLEHRNIDFYGIGKRNAKGIGKEEREWAQAYADGINDYAKSINFLPFEFYLTFSTWEDWRV